MAEKNLMGEVALITGSGRGLGRAIAERLAEAGAAVAIHDVSESAPAEFGEAANLEAVHRTFAEYGVPTIALTGDIADPDSVSAMKDQIEAKLGPLSILVNCAGGDIAAKGGKPKPNDALGIPLEDTRAIFDRNLIGTILVCQIFCPGMQERRRGSVINIGSTAAHAGFEDGVIYAVAKAGVIHYTRCLAKALRPYNVRVNAVSPGPTATARFKATRTTDPAMFNEENLIRYGAPRDIADAVAFLASDSARWIDGQVFCVDGGSSLYPI